MTIEVRCSKCRTSFNLRDESAGKRVRCRSCEAVITVPEADSYDDEVEDYGDIETDASSDDEESYASRRRRSSRRSTSKKKSQSDFGAAIFDRLKGLSIGPAGIVWCLIGLLGVVGCFFPPVSGGLVILGWLILAVTSLVGGICFLCAVAGESIMMCVLCFILPGWGLVCVFMYWDAVRTWVLLQLQGLAMFLVCCLLALVQMTRFAGPLNQGVVEAPPAAPPINQPAIPQPVQPVLPQNNEPQVPQSVQPAEAPPAQPNPQPATPLPKPFVFPPANVVPATPPPIDGEVRAPRAGERVITLKFTNFTGAGDVTEAARRALQGLPGANPNVLLIDQAGGRIIFAQHGGSLATAVFTDALRKAGFNMVPGVQIGPFNP